MQTKAMTIEAMSEAGKGLARIATLSAIDHDGDTYAPGAFSKGRASAGSGDQWVPIIPAHNRSAMPFGKARLYEEGDAAFAELHLNLATTAGKDWHSALKFDLDRGSPVQEWSYGYDVLDSAPEYRGGQKVRLLKALDVHEVSTVVRGAGHGSATLQMKGLKSVQLKELHYAPLLKSLEELSLALGEDPAALSATGVVQLGEIRDQLDRALAAVQAGGSADLANGLEGALEVEAARQAADGVVGAFLEHLVRGHLRTP